MSEDQRVAPRSRTFLPARVEIAEIGVAAPCTVRDLSDTGARIQISGSVTLPPSFTLHIPRFDRRVRVTRKWHRGDFVGVSFDRETGTAQVPETQHDARYVKKLEDEITRLKLLLEAIREDPMRARLLLDKAA